MTICNCLHIALVAQAFQVFTKHVTVIWISFCLTVETTHLDQTQSVYTISENVIITSYSCKL